MPRSLPVAALLCCLFLVVGFHSVPVVGKEVNYALHNLRLQAMAQVPLPGVPAQRNASRVLVEWPQRGFYAAPTLALPPLRIQLADAMGVPLLKGFGALARVRSVTKPPQHVVDHGQHAYGVEAVAPMADNTIHTTRTVTSHRQSAVFDGLQLLRPQAGIHALTVTVEQFNFTRRFLSETIQFVVYANLEVSALTLARLPEPSLSPYGLVPTQPVVVALDGAGNVVHTADGNPAGTGAAYDEMGVVVTGVAAAAPSGAYVLIRGGFARMIRGHAAFTELAVALVYPDGSNAGAGWDIDVNLTFAFKGTTVVESLRPVATWTVVTLAGSCNRSDVGVITRFAPDRVRRGHAVRVLVHGHPFTLGIAPRLVCAFGPFQAISIVKMRRLDVCSAECVVNSSHFSGLLGDTGAAVGALQVSLDGGRTWTNSSKPFHVVGHAVAQLNVTFDSPETRLYGNVIVEQDGATSLGNVTARLVDVLGTELYETMPADEQWHITAASARPVREPLIGAVALDARRGVAHFTSLAIEGFFPPGTNVTVHFRAEKISGGGPTPVGSVLQASLDFFLTAELTTRCLVPPVVLDIDAAVPDWCSARLGEGVGLDGCVSSSAVPYTITGRYFGTSGAEVLIGNKL